MNQELFPLQQVSQDREKNNFLANETGSITLKGLYRAGIFFLIFVAVAPWVTRRVVNSGKEVYTIAANGIEEAVDRRYMENRNKAVSMNLLASNRERILGEMTTRMDEISQREVLDDSEEYLFNGLERALKHLKERGAAIYVDPCLLSELLQVVNILNKMSAVDAKTGQSFAPAWQALYDTALNYQNNRNSLVPPKRVNWPSVPSRADIPEIRQ